MKTNNLSPLWLLLYPLLLAGCNQSHTISDSASTASASADVAAPMAESSEATSDAASAEAMPVIAMSEDASSKRVVTTEASASIESSESEVQAQSGIVTAGEWNDLAHWDFWTQLIDKEEFATHLEHWHIYPKHRVSVSVHSNSKPVSNAIVQLIKNSNELKSQGSQPDVVWTARTDNKGEAVLWESFFENSKYVDFKDYKLQINGQEVSQSVYPHYQEVVSINMDKSAVKPSAKKADIAFIVDATGSMQDEIDFLKRDLQSVIQAVEKTNQKLDIKTAAVFYRDVSENGHQEEYLVKKDDFGKLDDTMAFIQKQNADGGGNFPEAVDVALDTAINKLAWSDNAHARIAFLLLDAPPHHETDVLASVQKSIMDAASKGIKIIPITASGIDKETEFLMRSLAMGTNGTYTFITDDSGVGNSHIAASVGQYDVEKLNALMIRLIKESTDFE